MANSEALTQAILRLLRRSRRRLLRLLLRGVVLKEEPLAFGPEVAPALRDALLHYHPVVVAHRGGNDVRRLARSVAAGAMVCETDVRPRGSNLVIAHQGWLGPIAFDTNRRLLRLEASSLMLRRLLREASRLGCELMLDLKFESKTRVETLLREIADGGLTDKTWLTGKWRALDAAARLSDGKARLYYGVNNAKQLRRFLAEQPEVRRNGISLNKRLAVPDTVRSLHTLGVEVFVYTVSTPEEALVALKAGANGLITNDLTLVRLFGAKAPKSGRDMVDVERRQER